MAGSKLENLLVAPPGLGAAFDAWHVVALLVGLGAKTRNAAANPLGLSRRDLGHIVEFSKSALGLGGTLVVLKAVAHQDLAGSGDLDALGGRFVRLDLGHRFLFRLRAAAQRPLPPRVSVFAAKASGSLSLSGLRAVARAPRSRRY